MDDNRDMCLMPFASSSQIFWVASQALCWGAAPFFISACWCVSVCVCAWVQDKTSYWCAIFTFCRSVDNQNNTNTCTGLYSVLQNDILTGNTHTVEIKVDAPTNGNTANPGSTVSGNYAVQLVNLNPNEALGFATLLSIKRSIIIISHCKCANISTVKIWSLKSMSTSTISSTVKL